MREIVFYRMESGRCPAEEFLDSLPSRQAQKVAWVMQLVEELEIVPAHYFKKLRDTNGLWEIRVQVATEIYRFLGFFDKANKLIINHAFQKKCQKTPKREIDIAEARRKEYSIRRFKQ